jgi:hypothetical protein
VTHRQTNQHTGAAEEEVEERRRRRREEGSLERKDRGESERGEDKPIVWHLRSHSSIQKSPAPIVSKFSQLLTSSL